jgi:hypothetical protein
MALRLDVVAFLEFVLVTPLVAERGNTLGI